MGYTGCEGGRDTIFWPAWSPQGTGRGHLSPRPDLVRTQPVRQGALHSPVAPRVWQTHGLPSDRPDRRSRRSEPKPRALGAPDAVPDPCWTRLHGGRSSVTNARSLYQYINAFSCERTEISARILRISKNRAIRIIHFISALERLRVKKCGEVDPPNMQRPRD